MEYDQVLHANKPEVRSVTRCPEIHGGGASYSGGILQAGDLKMDLDRHLLWKANEEIHLSPREFELLSYLFKNQGALVTHVRLLRDIWGPDHGNELGCLRTYIRMLRQKIEDDPARPQYILTEPWTGYRFRDPSNLRGHNLSATAASFNWLSSCVVHDLRNPVATISAATEILMNVDAAPAEVKRLAANMYRAAGLMRDLLTEVSCATFGKVLMPDICELREVIVAASDAASTGKENQRVQVLLDVPRGIELPLVRSRIERVFFNLITNALEAMPGGGEIRIQARKDRNYVLIEIEDTGSGIPQVIRDRVFEPFVTAGKTNGLGLGLALSRMAVLDHGGDMWVEAAAGARFVIRFPLKRRSLIMTVAAPSCRSDAFNTTSMQGQACMTRSQRSTIESEFVPILIRRRRKSDQRTKELLSS